MHVSHSVHVNRPVKDVEAALARGATTWFPGLRDDARASVGPKVAGVPVRKGVRLEIGKPTKAGDWTNLPVTWKATGPKALFPEMAGRIELIPVEKDVTRLTVSGMYEPPLGELGKQLDQAVMHNVAEGTVKDLAESIAKKLRG